MKKGKKSENRSNSEAAGSTSLTTDGVFQHPASAAEAAQRGLLLDEDDQATVKRA